MSLEQRVKDFITEAGTDYKTFRSFMTGSNSGSFALATTSQNIKGSISELKDAITAAAGGMPTNATELAVGVGEIATTAETTTGTDDFRWITPLKLAQKLTAWAQPLSANLTSLSGVASTAYGRGFLALVNQAGLVALLPASSDTVSGIQRNATQAEVNTGTSDATQVTPLKLQTRLAAYAQPLAANLTTLAGVSSGAFGRTLLTAADVNAAKTSLALAAVATSGSASDITTGTLPTSVLPPLAINETFNAANQAAMLALTAQRGDVAIRLDSIGGTVGKMFILASDSPGTLADWKPITASSDVISVAGRTGVITLAKADVGLDQVDNTSDANKPVSTAQATADGLRLLKTANLSDVATPATALSNIGGIASTAIGNPEADLVAFYTAAKA